MEALVNPQKQTPESLDHLQTLDDVCGMPSPGQAHIGCILTSDQKGSLSQLKKLCLDHNYDLSNPDHYTDDAALLRYLRARGFDVAAAFEQFDFGMEWRKENGIEEFYNNLEVQSYEESRKMYPQWIGRRDHDGRPVYVFAVKNFTKKNLDEYLGKISSCESTKEYCKPSAPGYVLHFHALFDNLIRFVTPLVSELTRPNENIPVSASTHIIDISGVSLKQFFAIRKYLQESSEMATKHYPETLGRVFVVGAPYFFRSIWDVMSHWFDPATRSKLFLLSSSEAKSTLLSYIDASNLPVEYGGTLEWKWQDMPNLDKPMRELVHELYEASGQKDEIVTGPVSFQGRCIQLLGTENGQPRRNQFCRAYKHF
ncbi:CRAL-TRIO domain-containing protein [Penicillium nucicola]|uniref:CRAL-TRIO domain-containing protein n=1 Tax=Penicillium nucicola TaxID=1850975 RepID=UPI00254549A5|nr:CRAL-TRIO domain-containing protein [Penicillium nucicola]KAJ5742480.1 CRAL-TRIO domain-containing protein [Penicillium nucicola]